MRFFFDVLAVPTMQIINQLAAARIIKFMIGDLLKAIRSVKRISKNVIQVTYVTVHGVCSTFISLKKFKQDFVNFRKNNSRKLKVVKESNTSFKVINPEKQTQYNVIPYSTGVDCDCQDYHNQIVEFGRGCCKHGYATLQFLGFSSLQEYINFNATAA